MRRSISIRGCVRGSVRPWVRPFVGPSAGPSVGPLALRKTRTRRILCRVSGLVDFHCVSIPLLSFQPLSFPCCYFLPFSFQHRKKQLANLTWSLRSITSFHASQYTYEWFFLPVYTGFSCLSSQDLRSSFPSLVPNRNQYSAFLFLYESE